MTKRKNNYYAVSVGRKTGIFESWEACEAEVKGFPSAKFHGFPTRQLAESYLLAENEAKKQKTNDTSAADACCTTPHHVHTPVAAGGSERVENSGNDGVRAVWMNAPASASGTTVEAVSSSVVKVKNPYLSVEKKPTTAVRASATASASASASAANRAPFTASELRERTMALKREAAAGAPWSDATAKKEVLYDTKMFADLVKQQLLADDRKRKISDVLARKLALLIQESLTLKDKETQRGAEEKARSPFEDMEEVGVSKLVKPMQGDISQLALQKFYVQGVCIGWPYPKILMPQRQMAMRLVQALNRSLHTVLESPTGTGKSAAILCATLAWQRHHQQTAAAGTPVTKIFYCSRTHSQVEQMVASLKKTPYRPRMTVLGGRDRLCIHRHINPRDGTEANRRGVDINNACRVRVGNTEKERRRQSKADDDNDSPFGPSFRLYDDDNPPIHGPGDGDGKHPNEEEDANTKVRLTCPHYRQLTSDRTASMAQAKFAPTNCCSVGGEKTKMGVADIEDLVDFGLNPHVDKGVAIYRPSTSQSWGIKLAKRHNGSGCVVHETSGPAANEGTIKPKDFILKMNGKDMQRASIDIITAEAKIAKSPLELDVMRDHAMDDDDVYSPHSVCPYYMSRALAKNAELVLAPYNYILDPGIRAAMGIDLNGSVVVLDEGHNIEGTLREAGSGRFYELDLCEIINLLEPMTRGYNDKENDDTPSIEDVAHEFLLFVEALVHFLRDARTRFENNPGLRGAQAAIAEHHKFHTPDDKEFEVDYFGPSGRGERGKPVGCKPFFEKLAAAGISLEAAKFLGHLELLENSLSGDNESEEGKKEKAALDLLVGLLSKFSLAISSPEHFYISTVMVANGSFDYAAGGDGSGAGPRVKKPREIPSAFHGSNDSLPECTFDKCTSKGSVRHGEVCDGSTPKWETVLVLELLTPSLLLRPLASSCRTLVIASGSLAPLPSLCAELGLHPAPDAAYKSKSPLSVAEPPGSQTAKCETRTAPIAQTEDDSLKMFLSPLSPKPEKPQPDENAGRLQMKPGPLEADHVVNLEKQLRAISIGSFPDGTPLSVTFANYKQPGFYVQLGHAIASIAEAIPKGGVLVFMPSYTFLRNCLKCWKSDSSFSYNSDRVDTEIWRRFVASKKTVVVEPSGSQSTFEQAKFEFTDSIRRNGKALLLAVFRGKMSEGISFNDDNARAVICVGLPFPSAFDRSIKAKKDYNDEQRKFHLGQASLLPGQAWYQQQAYRAIAQALGRCIRHIGDYGTVVLLDRRHCDDGAPSGDGVCAAHRNLPKWMRSSVRNLSMSEFRFHTPNGFGKEAISGGYAGLTRELAEFFVTAKDYADEVLEKCQQEFEEAQARSSLTSPTTKSRAV